MSELGEKVRASIERIKAYSHLDDKGYYLAFSGGKDSVVCKALLEMAGVKYDAHYRVTSVDPPELVQFIKEKHKDVEREKPFYDEDFRIKHLAGKPVTMWNLIPWKLMPPTRLVRYCCEWLKESGGDGRFTVTGVRWAESVNRQKNQGQITITDKNAGKELADNSNFMSTDRGGVVLANDNAESRRTIEQCFRRMKTVLNPIIDWTDGEIWEFIKAENVPYCGLYDCGFQRLGCIGCPMARQHGREIEFRMWPKYKNLYIRTFDKMLEERRRRGKTNSSWGAVGKDVFNWWMEYNILPGQMDLFDQEEDVDSGTFWSNLEES